MIYFIKLLLFVVLVSFQIVSMSYAQDVSAPAVEPVPPSFLNEYDGNNKLAKDMVSRAVLRRQPSSLQENSTLLFTAGEFNLIGDAQRGLFTRPATEEEIRIAEEQAIASFPQGRGPREVSVGGIIYKSRHNWTIWINGEKITPKRIPSQILDIKVNKDTVTLKWFDAYTNQVFPIKLKSHQRFNIDTRIFLSS